MIQRLDFESFGPPPDVLQVTTAAPPSCPDGAVRLRLLASPINPADLNFIEGTYGIRPTLPATGGIESCAEVIESRSSAFQAGDRVISLAGHGCWASERLADPADLCHLPATVDPLQAAMLKVNPATAWLMLTRFRRLPTGSWIIQNAANSGVGQAVIQLAASLGLRTINLVRRTELIPELQALGADQVLLDEASAVDAIHACCGEHRPQLALNAVGGESALRLMNGLASGGIHITYGAMARRPLKIPNGLLIFKDLEIRGFWLSRWLGQAPRHEVETLYQQLSSAMARGDLTLPIDSTFPLAEAPAALARQAAADRRGKVLFIP